VVLARNNRKKYRREQLLANSDRDKIYYPKGYALSVDKPAAYCIRVFGYLDEFWSERLGGMAITSSCQAGGGTVTILSGAMIDQAALFGVLKALYDMRLPLISVECLDVN
jgi:hypothetical protein